MALLIPPAKQSVFAFECQRWLMIALTFLCAQNAFANTHDTKTLTYKGNAYDLNDSHKLLYTETHHLTLVNGKPSVRRVAYRSATKQLIVEKTNQYQQNSATPEFELQDLRTGYREQARFSRNGDLILTLQENGQAQEQSHRIDSLPSHLIIDAGFDSFVRQHWSELEAGKSVTFSFASVARLDLIDFRLLKKDSNKEQLVLSMRLKSRLLAWLLDPIELTYDRQSKRLLRYRGLGNIQDSQGNAYHVDIRYQYE